VVSDQFSGTTDTTWSQALGVSATLAGVTRGAFQFVFQVEDRIFSDSHDSDWSGLVSACVLHRSEQEDYHNQCNDGHNGISVRSVEVNHLYSSHIIFSKVR